MRVWLALFPFAACLLGGPSAQAADPAWNADEQAVAATDTAFYNASRDQHGRAWADFADETATTQVGHGKTEIGAAFEKLYGRPGFTLAWHPVFAKVVGDIGMTSGPYERHLADAKGQDQRSTGNYVTVWLRQPDGQWRFVWDGGTPDP
jgi:ketosteroid isomerase-like protein